MKLQITSASGDILLLDSFKKVSLMTESGEITVLPGHEPLLTALRPGIVTVVSIEKDGEKISEFVSGGGVANISPEIVTIVADVVENADSLTDLEYIAEQKKEAEKLMKEYREQNSTSLDPKRLLEIEYELLKFTAMHNLGHKHRIKTGKGLI